MRKLFDSDLQNLWNRSTRSATLYKATQFESAMDCYEEALEFGRNALSQQRIQKKDMARLYYNRGRAAEKCSQFTEALNCCNEALTLDPAYFSAMRLRATCKLQLFEFASACKDWEWVLDRRRLVNVCFIMLLVSYTHVVVTEWYYCYVSPQTVNWRTTKSQMWKETCVMQRNVAMPATTTFLD